MNTPIVITAIICISALQAWALYLGFNGVLLSTTLTLLGALAGWIGLKQPKFMKS